ncbi:unnamed protein product [Linum trigynum]|uniref:Uncharacterized protein n=1 Tax=Linum trigynum TaxID=586398 RepID=A0AAV2CD84_9ROSI
MIAIGELWAKIGRDEFDFLELNKPKNRTESRPNSAAVSESEFLNRGRVVEVPCGLTIGSHITVVGKRRAAHAEAESNISLIKDGGSSVMVSQFMIELQGLK